MNDLISRQEAIEELERMVKTHEHDRFGGELVHWTGVKAMLDLLPSAQPENDWIPVTKKAHPDLPIRVQVQMDNGWIITAFYQEGEWFSVQNCGDALRDEWIEAWRELPEPYAERREE